MEEKKELYGNLFGTIDILSEEHLDAILQTIDKENSVYYLIEAIKAAHRRNSFTIGETEIISKVIRTITK